MMITIFMSILSWMVAVTLTAWGTWIALRQFRRVRFEKFPDPLPPISILKPLKGTESGMRENLSSFFELDYPDYEIFLSVADKEDPAAVIAREVMGRYPHVRAELIVGEADAGPNPKVRNLLRGYMKAQHDYLLISDSNVRVQPDYLKHIVAYMTPGVGAVTAVVAGTAPLGIGGRLEAAYLNSFFARWVRIADACGCPCIIGKCMFFRRSTLERFGGLRTLSRYIAEDYMAGKAIQRLGLKIEIMPEPVPQYIGSHRFSEFWLRHLRWGRIRKSQAPVAFLVEPIFGAVLSGLLGAWSCHQLFGISRFDFFGVHCLVWFVQDCLVMRKMDPAGFRQFATMSLAWCLRETLAFPLWLHIACGNSIQWRGKRLKVLPGGLLVDT